MRSVANYDKLLKKPIRKKVRSEKSTEALAGTKGPKAHWGVANKIGEAFAQALNQSVLKKKRR
jgi:hypothetical protein